MLHSTISVFQKFNVNSLSLLLTIDLGNPYIQIIQSQKMLASYSAVKFFLNSINLAPFVILHTTLHIALYLYPITLSADLGKLVIKSIAISSYSLVGIGIGYNSL
jgi:hypothetical protein